MRFGLALSVSMLASSALAEMSMEERYADCIGLRAEARAFSNWSNANCQKTGDCPPFSSHWELASSVTTCIVEAVEVCSAPAKQYSVACFDQAQSLLDEVTQSYQGSNLLASLLNIVENGEGFTSRQAKRLIGQIESLKGAQNADCAGLVFPDAVIENQERGCAFYSDIIFLSLVAEARRLIQKEARE